MKKKYRRAVVMIAAVIVLGTAYLTGGKASEEDRPEPAEGLSLSAELRENTDLTLDAASEEILSVFVYVSGEVFAPGVYELPADARVCDALDAAGGLTDRAAPGAVNQAERVCDGDMVFIPAIGTEQVMGAVLTDGRININTASAAELTALPGIGESKAEMIVNYREKNGAFQCPEDILNVTGIGNSIFEQIREKIKV